jgi:hypothetical protein
MRSGKLGKASRGAGTYMPDVILTTYSMWEKASAVEDR